MSRIRSARTDEKSEIEENIAQTERELDEKDDYRRLLEA